MLKQIPNEKHLARMYYELALRGGACVGEKAAWPYKPNDAEELFCLAAEMSRHDPRLFSVLVRFLNEHWRDLNPCKVRSYYPEMATPQTVAVAAEFLLRSRPIEDEAMYFFEYLQTGLLAVTTQFYFQNLYRPGGNLARLAAEAPLTEYKTWGFLARESPVIDEAGRRPLGTRDAASRKNILLGLFKENDRVKLSDYLAALKFGISRQQALLDIRGVEGIRRAGKGRGACWRITA